MKTIAILGARGRLSRMVARAFLAQNWQVIAITRDGKAPEGVAQADCRAADAMDKAALISACQGADVIFNGLNPIYTEWADKVPVFTANVIAAAKATGALHLLPGNVYNYGRSIPDLADETTAMPGDTGKGKIRNAMEQAFKDAAKNGVKTIILRAGDFYGGDGRGSWFDLAITAKLDKGAFTWPGAMDIDHAWAYLPDLAQAFVKLADKGCGSSGYEHYTFEGHTLSGTEMKRLVEQALGGKSLKQAGMPWLLLRAGGLVVPMWREISEMSYLWFTPHRLSGDKLAVAIGPFAQTAPDIAVAKALAELGFDRSGLSHAA
ncbi:NADH(P)-binding [Hoeflea sp. IMCC20628]|uniref:NAD(P)H-binding protein n=1 Tax=Hoeflea sp. IMCC20628 TaxID=1620421 RepID=UPI00063AB455|nr:NAD(P)H-binding protein [Hoeflea sp. IMCC20628]AKI02856.1 NADH(P)-binding [Hoeflea sp. IMCC20628]